MSVTVNVQITDSVTGNADDARRLLATARYLTELAHVINVGQPATAWDDVSNSPIFGRKSTDSPDLVLEPKTGRDSRTRPDQADLNLMLATRRPDEDSDCNPTPEQRAAFVPPAPEDDRKGYVPPPPGMMQPCTLPASVAVIPADIDVDSNGIPWDVRIHSRTKSKNKTGAWKVKRDADPATVQRIEAELRAVGFTSGFAAAALASVANIIPPPPGQPSQVTPQPGKLDPSYSSAPTGAMPQHTGNTPPPPPPPPAAGFPALTMKISELVAARKITLMQVKDIIGQFGFTDLPKVAAREDLVPAISASIDQVALP